jgi:hypothetical protein
MWNLGNAAASDQRNPATSLNPAFAHRFPGDNEPLFLLGVSCPQASQLNRRWGRPIDSGAHRRPFPP